MVNYEKWDKLADSEGEDETETAEGRAKLAHESDDRERRRDLQEQICSWLKRQMHLLKKDESEEQQRAKSSRKPVSTGPRHDYSTSGMFGGGGVAGGMLGMGIGSGMGSFESSEYEPKPKPSAQYRQCTNEELKVVSMFVSVSDFDEGETNLTRHPELLDLVRHNRWLEDDPGTLELLCRIHNGHMRRAGDKDRSPAGESDLDARMRHRLMCGINTLAAPKQEKLPGGLLDMMTQICTPETDAAREMRRNWQKKEYAKNAIFKSLFPEMGDGEDPDTGDSMWEIWLMLGLIILIVVGIICFVCYIGPLSQGSRKAAKNATAKVAAAVSAAVGAEGFAEATGKAEL